MTITTTTNTVTFTGNGATTSFAYTFIIPDEDDAVVTITTISTGATSVLASSAYTITGIDDPNGGTVTYPLIGSPLSNLYTITIQRIEDLTQTTDLVNQGPYSPSSVEDALDKTVRLIQQLNTDVQNALAFPIGASSVTVAQLITDILNGATNATAAAASAAAAAASAATVAAAVPVSAANIQSNAVTTAKILANNVTLIKLDGSTAIWQGVGMIGGYLVATVAAGALTIAVKTLAAADPSATDPVYFVFRNATAATGSPSYVSVTAALSLVISSGSTLGVPSNSSPFRLWITAFNDAGTVRLAAINCLGSIAVFAGTYPLSAWEIASSTAEGGAGAADSAKVFYTGTAVASKSYCVLGYMTWETGLAAIGNWAAGPTRIQLFGPDVPLPGRPVQQITYDISTMLTGTTVVPLDNTIPTNAEGDIYATQAITPQSAANLIRVGACGNFAVSVAATIIAFLHQSGAAALAVAAVRQPNTGVVCQIVIPDFVQLAAVTTAITYDLKAGPSTAGTVTFNGAAGAALFGGVYYSHMTIVELQG